MGGGSSKKKVVQNNDVMAPVVPATTNAVNAENQPEVEQQMSAFDEVTTEAAEDMSEAKANTDLVAAEAAERAEANAKAESGGWTTEAAALAEAEAAAAK